jgi:hypothetical protein
MSRTMLWHVPYNSVVCPKAPFCAVLRHVQTCLRTCLTRILGQFYFHRWWGRACGAWREHKRTHACACTCGFVGVLGPVCPRPFPLNPSQGNHICILVPTRDHPRAGRLSDLVRGLSSSPLYVTPTDMRVPQQLKNEGSGRITLRRAER